MLSFPDIDPVAVQLGPLAIRWYSLAYIGGILLGWWIVAREHAKNPLPGMTKPMLDDMIIWAVGGIILGGRLGYVLFYKPAYYLENPAHIFQLWEGGMSFHGGMIGTIVAFYLFARKNKIPYLPVIDLVAAVTPIGLFLGRVANFINGELYGRVTDSYFGMIFPHGGDLPRHPSQLYQATLEGIVLFTILMLMLKCFHARSKPGLLGGTFLFVYGIARIVGEFFREPDAHLGFLWGHTTMGQLLCVPMLMLGAYLMFRPNPNKAAA